MNIKLESRRVGRRYCDSTLWKGAYRKQTSCKITAVGNEYGAMSYDIEEN